MSSLRVRSEEITSCEAENVGLCSHKALKVLPGPISRRIASGVFSAYSIPFEKRTVWRSCLAQYSGSVASASVIQVPVALEM